MKGAAIENAALSGPLNANGGKLWRDLLLSLRWHLVGMSAVWLVAGLLNMDYSGTSSPAVAKQNAPSPSQVLVALRENRRQLSELIETPVAERIPAPRTIVPRRRSELQSSNAVA